jgi:hypothetical protein
MNGISSPYPHQDFFLRGGLYEKVFMWEVGKKV